MFIFEVSLQNKITCSICGELENKNVRKYPSGSLI